MTTDLVKIPDKSGELLDEEQVKEKLEKILEDICLTNFVDSVIASLFSKRCKVEFPTFQSVTGSWSTRPRVVNVYFQGSMSISLIA